MKTAIFVRCVMIKLTLNSAVTVYSWADITAVNLILKISTRVLYIKITSMPSAVRTECLFVRQKMSES